MIKIQVLSRGQFIECDLTLPRLDLTLSSNSNQAYNRQQAKLFHLTAHQSRPLSHCFEHSQSFARQSNCKARKSKVDISVYCIPQNLTSHLGLEHPNYLRPNINFFSYEFIKIGDQESRVLSSVKLVFRSTCESKNTPKHMQKNSCRQRSSSVVKHSAESFGLNYN